MNREIIGTVRKLIVGLFLTMALAACAGTPSVGTPTADARTDLAPSGKLRVALLLGSSLFVNKDPVTGEVRGGMAVEVARALAERLGVPFEPVGYANVAKFMEAVKSNEWDIIVFGIDPTRAGVLDFTTPFLEVDSTYLVPGNSPIRSVIDADQPGVRIAVPAKSGQDLYFSRHPLKHAVLVRGEGAPATFQLLKTGKADAFAENRQVLLKLSQQLPGSRILEERFDVLQIAIALPKGRAAGRAYAERFVREAIGSGQAHEWVKRAGLNGVRAASR